MLSEQERVQILNNAVYSWIANGWTCEASNPPYAILSSKKKVNHWLHLFLTLFTFSFWILIWAAIALTAGTVRYQLFVDENGKVHQRKL